jgi:hypothetical protein
MAISANAMTLAEFAQIANDPMITQVVWSLRAVNSVLADIPWITKKTLKANGLRVTGNLPTVGWTKLNTTPSAVKGAAVPFEESAFIIRNLIEVDHAMVEDESQIVDPRAFHMQAYLKAVAYDFNDKFINNTPVLNGDAIVGIRCRLDNPTVYGALAASKIDAGGAVITTAATAAQANAFMEWVDQLLYAVDAPEGQGVVIYANATLLRRFATLVRLLGAGAGFAMSTDNYGRSVSTYKGAVLKDIGLKGDQTTNIITNTETTAGVGGASTYTSMYAVRYGDTGLTGWQFAPLTAKDLGQDPVDGVVFRTFIEWIGGLLSNDIRSIARLYGLKIS